jgi:hypothetical protein
MRASGGLRTAVQLSVERVDVAHQPLERMALEHVGPGGARTRVNGSGIVERLENGPGESPGLAGGGEAPSRAAAEEVGRAADLGGDDRAAGGHRLDERDRRALVARGVHDHVEVAVDGTQVGAPSREAHDVREAQLARQTAEGRPLLAVADEGKARGRPRVVDEAGGAKERRHVLDRHETPDHPDERRILRDPDLAAQLPPRERSREVSELEAERDHADPLGTGDAEVNEVVLHRVGHGHERVGEWGEPCLQTPEDGRFRRGEVSAEHVAVVRVHDRRHPGEARGHATQQTRLRGVCVNDRRPPLTHQAAETEERPNVGERGDFAAEAGERLALDALLTGEAAHVALALRLCADDEAGLVTSLAQVGAQQDHVDGRPPHVEPGEDAQDTHLPPVLPRGCGHRNGSTSRPVGREGSIHPQVRQPKFPPMSEIGRIGVPRFAVGWRRALVRRRLSAMANGRGATYALGVLVGLVVLSPWPFGSVLPRTTQAIVLVTLGTSLVALALSLPGRRSSPILAVDGRLVTAPLFALGLWTLGALQLLPLPRTVHALLAPGSASVWHPTEVAAAAALGAGPHPASVYPAATVHWLAFFAGVVSLAIVAAAALGARRALLRTSVTVVSMAVVIAVYAFAARLWFGDRVFGVYQAVIPPFGPFVSKNHFAGYVEIAALLAVGLATGLASENRDRPGVFGWIESPQAGRVVMAWAAAAVLVLAVPVSLSRGGVVSLAAGLAAFVFLRLASRRDRPRLERSQTAVAAMLAGAAIIAAAIFLVLPEPARARIATIGVGGGDSSSSYRLRLWRDTLELVASSPLVGSGLGAYSDAVPRFKTAAGNVRVEHAESDWLELLAEGGFMGGGLAVGGVAFVVASAWRNLCADVHRLSRAVRTGAVAGLVALCVHSFFDFNLHIPSNALLASLAGAIALAVTPAERAGCSTSTSTERDVTRFGVPVATLVLCASTALALMVSWPDARTPARLATGAGPLRRSMATSAVLNHLRGRPCDAEAWLILAWLEQATEPRDSGSLAAWSVRLDPADPRIVGAARRLGAVLPAGR